MKLADFNRLKKFMAMTMSENESEMMAAIKMANTILIQQNLTWQRVLDRSIKVVAAVEAAPEDYREPAAMSNKATEQDAVAYDVDEVNEWIELIERRANLKGDFEDTITSIIEQHREGKRLSFKQRELLSRISRQ